MSKSPNGPLRVGIGGPVGSGKTALMEALCKAFRDRYDICAITNDIYTKEDALILVRAGALPEERIMGVETGGCPHTAIREDASINLAAIAEMRAKYPALDLILIESGGDNLAATFSPELADLTIYVIDVAQGEKIPRKGGPGITRSDLLVINKIDLAPHVGASLEVMETGHAAHARRAAVRFHQPEDGRGRRRRGAFSGAPRRARLTTVARRRASASGLKCHSKLTTAYRNLIAKFPRRQSGRLQSGSLPVRARCLPARRNLRYDGISNNKSKGGPSCAQGFAVSFRSFARSRSFRPSRRCSFCPAAPPRRRPTASPPCSPARSITRRARPLPRC